MGSKSLGAHPCSTGSLPRGGSASARTTASSGPGTATSCTMPTLSWSWTRAHARTYGGDPDKVLVAGGSSVRTWQQPPPSPEPPFAVSSPSTATSGTLDVREERARPPTTTSMHRRPRSSSFTVLRTPWCFADDARAFADRLRAVSRQPVAYAELPGAQHNFDFFHSLRFHSVIDAVADFAALTPGPALRSSAASRSS